MKLLKSLFVLLLLAQAAAAQNVPDSLPYKRYPELPPLQLLLGDSTTLFTKENLVKKKPVLVLFFSPSCGHCQFTIEDLVVRKDSLPDMQLLLATFSSISEMNAFRTKYKTDLLPHTTVGKDIHFLLPPFYGIAYLPFYAYYDRKGRLVDTFESSIKVPALLDRIRELQKGKN
jgi:thiol-disulfide isomerase/thioredoxin